MRKLNRARWDQRAGAAVNARRRLPLLVSGYFDYVRKVLVDDPPPAKLHLIRLATKRLRYTLELFRACYGPGLETRLAVLRRVQQALGKVNDSVATARLISGSMAPSPHRLRIEKFLAERAAADAQGFRREWVEVIDAEGQELWWTRYLARHARAPRK
jgi:hypothetical protein